MITKRLLLLIFINICLQLAVNAQDIIFTPQWTPQSQWAGYYVAYEKGFYKDAGVNVVISHRSASNTAINKMIHGECNATTMQLVEAIKYRDQGIKLVNVLQTSQNNALMLVTFEKIHSIKDISGMKVGRWKAGFYDLATVYAKENNLDIEWIPFLNNINLLVSGAIDATLCMSYNEYYQIMASGNDIPDGSAIRFSDLGYNIPEDGVYVLEDFYNQHFDVIEKFNNATKQGWEWAAANPEEALNIVMKYTKKYHIGTNIHHQRWMLNEIIELQKDKVTGKQTFSPVSKETYTIIVNMLKEHGIINKSIDYKDFIK